jgi:AcrR family transcriptional regulator
MPDNDSPTPLTSRHRGLSLADRQRERRERILAAAYEALGDHGVAGVSLRLIGAVARVQDKHLREQFETVQQLYGVVHDQLAAEIGARMSSQYFAAGGASDARAGFRAALVEYFQYLKDDPRRAQILVIDAFAQGALDVSNMNAYIGRYGEILRYRLKLKYPLVAQPVDAGLVLAGLVGQVLNSALVWVSGGFAMPVDRLVDHCMFGFTGMQVWLQSENDAAASSST